MTSILSLALLFLSPCAYSQTAQEKKAPMFCFSEQEFLSLGQSLQELEQCNRLYKLSLELELELEGQLNEIRDVNQEMQLKIQELTETLPPVFDWQPMVYGFAVGVLATTALALIMGG